MRKIRSWLSSVVPAYSIFPLLLAVTFNLSVYGFTRMIAGNWYHYNIESPLDELIPFWPPSIIIYLGCYLFWVVNYILMGRQGKKQVCQFFAADFISRVVCMVFYLAFPTTNVRPAVEPAGIWNQVTLFLYQVDAADNLFPSIHCLVSWFCYIGLRGRKDIPVWYKCFSCVMAVLVCISTLTTKQHVIVDVFGGVLLAEVCLWLGRKPAVWGTYQKVADKVYDRIFSRKQDEGLEQPEE